MFLIWAKHLRHAGYGEHNSIWINIDETALPLYVGGRHGNIVRLPKRIGKPFSTKATLAERRAHVTLLATVCNDPDLQKHMPQVLMPNTVGKKRLWRAAETVVAETPAVCIEQTTTGWITADLLVKAMRRIKAVCTAHAPEKHIVLVMDGHSTHVTKEVLRRARAMGMRPLIIPAKLTPQLQVLDVYVFSQFKLALHRAHTAALLGSDSGTQDFIAWVVTTMRVIQDVFANFNACEAFARVGQSGHVAPLRQELLSFAPNAWTPPPRQLSQDELWFLLGRRLRGIHSQMFTTWTHYLPVPPPVAAPRLKRLHSKTTL